MKSLTAIKLQPSFIYFEMCPKKLHFLTQCKCAKCFIQHRKLSMLIKCLMDLRRPFPTVMVVGEYILLSPSFLRAKTMRKIETRQLSKSLQRKNEIPSSTKVCSLHAVLESDIPKTKAFFTCT